MGGAGALRTPAARWAPFAPLALVAVALLVHGPIPQLDHYHEFADTRAFLGVPNAGDVLSSAGFLLVGAWGWSAIDARAPLGFKVFLAGLVLTALGSSYYHLAPDNARLVWDRIPIALACAGLIAGYYADTHRIFKTLALNVILAIVAVAAVLWWSYTDRAGVGDLRPYLLMQAAPLLIVPFWQWFADSPRSDRLAFGAAIVLYAMAKAAELGDRTIYDALGFVSGHTLKHLLATVASAILAASMVRRARAG